MMAFYRICPDCGAYLDPGEQCSCHEERLIEMERKEKAILEMCVPIYCGGEDKRKEEGTEKLVQVQNLITG